MTGFNTSPGIVSAPIERNVGQWQEGLTNYRPPLSAVLGATLEDALVEGPAAKAVRSTARALAQPTGEAGNTIGYEGSTIELPKPTVLTAKEANERFGIIGHLKFDTDTPESVALEFNALKRAELVRADIMERSPGGLIQGAAVLGTSLVASALDPLNVASAFLPIVSEARMATWLARAGEGALSRAGVRAGAGALEGIAGQAVLTPITYGVARQEQADYHAVDVMLDLAVGGALGAGLHVGLGALTDRFRPRLKAAAGEAEPTLPEKIAAAPIETREAAMRAAVAQMADTGQVDNIEAIFRAEASRLNVEHLLSSTAAPRLNEMGSPGAPRIEYATPPDGATRGKGASVVNRPLDLFEFLAAQGGLEPSAELSGMGLDKTFVPRQGKLVREGGLPLDRARALAEEAGYIGGAGADYQTTDLNHILDALDRHARGDKVYSLNDLEAVHEHGMKKRLEQEHEREAEALAEVHAVAKEHGLKLSDNEARELGELVRQGHDPLDAMTDILERGMLAHESAAATHAKEKGHANDFDIPFEPRRSEETGRAAEVAREPSAGAQQGAEGGHEAPGGERGGRGEEAPRASGPTLELEDHPALASALEASRAADGELEMLKTLGHVTGNEPELLAAELEVARAESTSRGYDAAGACLERSA